MCEFQNAYATSRAMADTHGDTALIQTARRAGLFCVVVRVTLFCQFSDASLGVSSPTLLGAYKRRREAIDQLAAYGDPHEDTIEVMEPVFADGMHPGLGDPERRFARGWREFIADDLDESGLASAVRRVVEKAPPVGMNPDHPEPIAYERDHFFAAGYAAGIHAKQAGIDCYGTDPDGAYGSDPADWGDRYDSAWDRFIQDCPEDVYLAIDQWPRLNVEFPPNADILTELRTLAREHFDALAANQPTGSLERGLMRREIVFMREYNPFGFDMGMTYRYRHHEVLRGYPEKGTLAAEYTVKGGV